MIMSLRIGPQYRDQRFSEHPLGHRQSRWGPSGIQEKVVSIFSFTFWNTSENQFL